MSDTKTYKANQRIRRNGKLYTRGDTMNLTEAEALPLHVVPVAEEPKKELKISTDGTAKEAIAMIETKPFSQLEGFVTGDEDRTTVTAAWEARQNQAGQEDKS